MTEDGPLEFEPSNQDIEWKLRWQFRLNDDDEKIEEVHAQLRQDSGMAKLVDRYNGLRIMRVDPWECLVFFILSAHNHYQTRVATAPTAGSMDKIAERFWEGNLLEHGRYPFPSPKQVGWEGGLPKLQELWSEQNDSPMRIRGLADMPRRIYDAARFVEAGRLHDLKGVSIDHAVKSLETMLRGVGAKTASCVALFGLGHMDAFPVDTHVTEALLSLYGRDPFQPYAGYASQLLFMEGLDDSSRR